MTKKLIWRLKELPSSKALALLVDTKILTKEDAKLICIDSSENGRNIKSLKDEIEFLRELVRDLSKNNIQIVDVIKRIEGQYTTYPWYEPYQIWATNFCSGSQLDTASCATDNGKTISVNSFTDIQTF